MMFMSAITKSSNVIISRCLIKFYIFNFEPYYLGIGTGDNKKRQKDAIQKDAIWVSVLQRIGH